MSLIFILLVNVSSAQLYGFVTGYVCGIVVMKDSTEKDSYIKWNLKPLTPLKFMAKENSKVINYRPSDILGFEALRTRFVSVGNLKLYGENYNLFGVLSSVKETFGYVYRYG